MVTFDVAENKRTVAEVVQLIREFSWQISSFEQLLPTLHYALSNSQEKQAARDKANQVFFDHLDGKAGWRAAQAICDYFPELKAGNQ